MLYIDESDGYFCFINMRSGGEWCYAVSMNRLILVLLPVISMANGCMLTSAVVHDGWKVGTYASGAEMEPGHQPPAAYKDTNGDVIFSFDAIRQPCDWSGEPKMEKRRLVRFTNIVSVADLRPIFRVYRFWSNYCFDVSVPVAETSSDLVSLGQPMPIGERPVVENRVGFPGRECAYLDEEWIWYIPPRNEGDSPQVALLSKHTEDVSSAGVAGRILLMPPCLAVDTVLAPIEIYGYILSGGVPKGPSPFLASTPAPKRGDFQKTSKPPEHQ